MANVIAPSSRSRSLRRRRPNADLPLATPLQQIGRTHVRFRGKKLAYFAGCDYFRLASHPDVIAAVRQGLQEYGLNVAASRKTTGNHLLYVRLEQALAKFFGAETATLTSNGYATNLCVGQALAGEFSRVLIDEKAHGSLYDAAELVAAPVETFAHRNPKDLARRIDRIKRARRTTRLLVLTDGLFAHSGEVAPLPEYLEVVPKNSLLLVDDAHAAGVLGRHGRGTVEFFGVPRDRLIQTITLSKAFGVYGGAIIGPKWLGKQLTNCSRLFIGNTPLPLPLAAGVMASLNLVRRDSSLRRRLACNTGYIKSALNAAGLDTNDGPGPIVPIHPRSAAIARRLSRALLTAGIHPPLINYLGRADTAYFRFVISSEHDAAQLDALIETIVRELAPNQH